MIQRHVFQRRRPQPGQGFEWACVLVDEAHRAQRSKLLKADERGAAPLVLGAQSLSPG